MVVSCSEFKEDLSSFIDGELEEHRQTILAQHLSACAGCRADHNGFKTVGSLMQKATARVQQEAPDLWTSLSVNLPSTCQCVQEDFSAYLDGELAPTAKEGITEHLEKCSPCLSKFNDLSKVTNLLSKGLVLPASVDIDIWAGVKARLNDDCIVIRSELSAFVDKEVATLRHRAITSHLTECMDCSNEFSELSQSGDVLRSYYQPEIPENFDLWPAIKASMNVVPMEATREKRRAPQPVRRLYAVAAAVFTGAVASATIMWFSHQSSPQVQPVTAEAYLIDQSLGDPADVAEAVVYDHTP